MRVLVYVETREIEYTSLAEAGEHSREMERELWELVRVEQRGPVLPDDTTTPKTINVFWRRYSEDDGTWKAQCVLL